MLLVNITFAGMTQASAGIASLGEAGFVCTAPFFDDTATLTVQVEYSGPSTGSGERHQGVLDAIEATVKAAGGVLSPHAPRTRIGWMPQARHAHQPRRFGTSE